METRYPVLVALLVLGATPTFLAAQSVPMTFDPAAANAIRLRPEVVAASSAITQRNLVRQRLIGSLGFREGEMCVTPTPVSETTIDLHRSMMVHDAATLGAGDFSLRRTLQKLATDVAADVPGATPLSIFRQLWDSQAAAPGVDATNPHCSDANGKIGAFPFNRCPRSEAAEAAGSNAAVNGRIDDYVPIALVNRLDLADKGWKNCGEHRIIYGKSAGGIRKNFVIFEAVLPNPKPGCRSGCRDVVEFWNDLSADSSPASRAAKLDTFFYAGLPGFRPVVHTSHYSSGVGTLYGNSGSGQIRTNQFIAGDSWTLKEFKTLLSCAGGTCRYDLMPISVKANPYGALWNRNVATGSAPTAPSSNTFATPIAGLAALATDFQADVLAQVTSTLLGNPDINSFTYEVKLDKNAAESQSSGGSVDNYRTQANNAADAAFRDSLANAGAGLMPPLTANQLVNRALAQSCAGCHQPSGFGLTAANAIGPGMAWPNALNFVHVDVQSRAFGPADGFDTTRFGGNAGGFDLSPALLSSFLPARRTVLATEVNNDVCDCVRKPDRLDASKKLRFAELVKQSNLQIRRDLDAARRATITTPETLLKASRTALAEAERARDARLRELGVGFETPTLKADRVVLSSTRLDAAAGDKARRAAIERIVDAEPPRETLTGSFRSH